MVKRQFVSLRPKDFIKNQWYNVILLKPNQHRVILIPRKGAYIAYKACFDNKYVPSTKVFDVVFPYHEFKLCVDALPRSVLQNLARPIKITFKYNYDYSLSIKSWQVL